MVILSAADTGSAWQQLQNQAAQTAADGEASVPGDHAASLRLQKACVQVL